VNPNDSAAAVTLSLKFSDSTMEIARVTVPIPPRGQLSRSLREVLDIILSTFSGTLDISSSQPVNIVGLRRRTNEEENVLMTALPVVDMGTLPNSARAVLPYVIDGSGFRTQITLVNPQSATNSGLISFFTSDGILQLIDFISLFK
jgi:hypothetical protein